MTPPSILIAVLSACNFLIGMGVFVIVGVLEPLGADFGISAASAGTLMTVYALSYAVLSPVLVSLTGAMGRRRVMALGLSMFLAAAFLSAVSPNMTVLSAARLLAAAGAGLFTPVAAAVAAGLYPAEQRARVLAAVFFGLSLAQVIGVPAGGWIGYTFGWQWAFWLVVGLAFPCIALIWVLVPSGLAFQPVSLRDLMGTLRNGRMMLAVLFTATFLAAVNVLYTYIAPLLSETMGYGRDGITLVLVVFGGGAVIGNIMGGILADRIGWHRTLTLLCILQACIMPTFSLLPLPAPFLLALTFAWSMSGWSFMAGQQLRLIGLAGPQAPVVLALNAAAIYVGIATGSAIGGLAILGHGISSVGMVAGAVAVMALLHLTLSAKIGPTAQTA
ncbi:MULTISPECIES: MFS transporter [Roseobacteraceae]|uniref:MFS transporter n=1 Tax=Roseobacteraceae TaxID=2854170 RepID=UPI001C448FAD|nr:MULTISPECIES: MFS transporter [Roseobacteraceae]MBV7408878.1 MFS transporter [Maritimibacter sp. DP1N21-5]MBY5934435.1 MFS transporter [Tateyamaria omphalii]